MGVEWGCAGGVLQELKEVEQRRGMDGGREGEERGGESPHAVETTRERGGGGEGGDGSPWPPLRVPVASALYKHSLVPHTRYARIHTHTETLR